MLISYTDFLCHNVYHMSLFKLMMTHLGILCLQQKVDAEIGYFVGVDLKYLVIKENQTGFLPIFPGSKKVTVTSLRECVIKKYVRNYNGAKNYF